ncbi:membrane MLC1-like protein [Labeo rohita]|uniref:Membrane MLC1-like protein n=1 Tax=Labeo rohita TaxID=84645 RepID=A0A498LRH9_LABRO|nr:membrane MLC1-like protein [Labeo rohita]
MQREEASAQEVFSYAQMSTLERNSGVGTLSRHLERERLERDSYTVDVRASDLQLDQPGPLHPCFSYRVWLYSVVIGSSLLIVAAFSLYMGNVFPDAMDYLRCTAGSSIPAAVVSFAIAKNRQVAINFNLLLLIVLEVLTASTVILSARSADDCCSHGKPVSDGPVVVTPASFPTRLLKAYAVIEVIVGISAVFGGIIALNLGALLPEPYLSVTFFWILVACFPSAIASHVVAEYPSKSLVEMLIAISSVTSPLLFSASGFLSNSVINFIEIFLHEVPLAKQSYDILLLVLMGLLLVQAVLTLATIVKCASYKSQLHTGSTEWDTLHKKHSEPDDPVMDGSSTERKSPQPIQWLTGWEKEEELQIPSGVL